MSATVKEAAYSFLIEQLQVLAPRWTAAAFSALIAVSLLRL
jgi:hypothetical protein